MNKEKKASAPRPRPREELINENEALRDEVLRLNLQLTDLGTALGHAQQQAKDLQDELARPENAHLALARAAAETYRDSWQQSQKRLRRQEQATAEAQQARERVQLTVSYQAGLLQLGAEALDHDDWHTLPHRARALTTP